MIQYTTVIFTAGRITEEYGYPTKDIVTYRGCPILFPAELQIPKVNRGVLTDILAWDALALSVRCRPATELELAVGITYPEFEEWNRAK